MDELRIHYFGPGLAGRTSSLRSAREAFPDATAVQTHEQADGRWLEWTCEVGNARLVVTSLNGGVSWERLQTRLRTHAHAVIFVVDSQAPRIETNEEHRDILIVQYGANGPAPLVLQWNKRDLDTALPVAELSRRFNRWRAPEVPSIASRGIGVVEAFRTAISLARQR